MKYLLVEVADDVVDLVANYLVHVGPAIKRVRLVTDPDVVQAYFGEDDATT